MSVPILLSGSSSELHALRVFMNSLRDASLHHYASEVFEEMDYSSHKELERVIKRTVMILKAAELPISDHIRMTFRANRYYVFKDWKVSELSRHLLMINGSPCNRLVARHQIQCIQNQMDGALNIDQNHS